VEFVSKKGKSVEVNLDPDNVISTSMVLGDLVKRASDSGMGFSSPDQFLFSHLFQFLKFTPQLTPNLPL
jgi:hypothetical protein